MFGKDLNNLSNIRNYYYCLKNVWCCHVSAASKLLQPTTYHGCWSDSLLLLLLFWHVPMGVHSAKCRHQKTVLSQVDCFIQCEVVSSQISLDSVQPRDVVPWCPAGLLQFSDGGAVRIILASASSSMHAICPNKERCRDWIVTVRSSCLVILLTSSLCTNWCHLSQSSVLKHPNPRFPN